MKKQSVLLVWFHDYHTFRFVKDIIPVLLAHGYAVTLLTCDGKLKSEYESAYKGQDFTLLYRPLLRPVLRHTENKYLRAFGWLLGWAWSYLETRKFDAVLAPRDTTPFYHMATSWKPSLVCRPALGFQDKTYVQHKFDASVPFPDIMQFIPQSHRCIDKVLGGNFLAQARGNKGLKYYTALGEWIAEFLEKLGIPKDHIFITGNFSYEGLTPQAIDPAPVQSTHFSDVPDNTAIYTFFSSHQQFSDIQIANLNAYLDALFAFDPSACFVLKVHPKMDSENILKLQTQRIKVISDLAGDENNARLIMLSCAVLVEESNVGILAAQFDTPLIVIDLGGKKDSEGNIFTLFQDICVCLSPQTFARALSDMKANMEKIREAQKNMVRCICAFDQSPCGHIPNILKRMIQNK